MNFTEQLNEVGIVLNDTQRSQFDKYFEILVEWNGFMNLTGITEYEAFFRQPCRRKIQ